MAMLMLFAFLLLLSSNINEAAKHGRSGKPADCHIAHPPSPAAQPPSEAAQPPSEAAQPTSEAAPPPYYEKPAVQDNSCCDQCLNPKPPGCDTDPNCSYETELMEYESCISYSCGYWKSECFYGVYP